MADQFIVVSTPGPAGPAGNGVGANGPSGEQGIVLQSDTNLYRSAANTLKTDDSFIVGDDLTVTDDVTLASGSVMTWATDTNLYRSAADTLKTDDSFEVGNDLTVADDITLASGSVATWATDTNLYRNAADVLKTDDSLIVGANLTVTSRVDLPSVTTDPSGVVDGSIWYENDVDLVRARVNGVTEALGFLTQVNQRTTDTGTINSTTLVAVCTVTLNPGTYAWNVQAMVVGDGTASTVGFAPQGTAVTSAWRWNGTISNTGLGNFNNGTTIPSTTSGVALDSLGTSTSGITVLLSGTVTVTTAGTFIIAFSRTAGTGTFVAKENSILTIHRTG